MNVYKPRKQGQLSRADLLDALVLDEGALAYLSQQLGLEKQPESIAEPPEVKETKQYLKEKPVDNTVLVDLKKDVRPAAGFWLLEKREVTLQQPIPEIKTSSSPLIWSDQAKTAPLPVHYPLASPRSLLARLLHHLKHQRPSRAVDVNVMVKKISRGEHLQTLPRATRRSLGQHLHIIDDRQLHLTPYWRDHYLFANLIASLLPDYCNSRAVLQHGQSLPLSIDSTGQLSDWQLPPEGSVVLIFSDLAALAMQKGSLIDTWLNIARVLKNRDCKLIAVLPCHYCECDWRLKTLFEMESWENRQHLQAITQSERLKQAEELLILLSPAIRLEPSLLRSVRTSLALHGKQINAAVESLVWQHPAMQEPSSVAATLNTETRKHWLKQFCSEEKHLQEMVLTILRTWRTKLQQQVWFEEIINLDESSRQHHVPAADIEAAIQYFQQLITHTNNDCVLTANQETQWWLRRMEKRLQDTACHPVLQEIIAQLHKDDQSYHTPLLDLDTLPPVNLPEQTVELYQQGESIVIGSSSTEYTRRGQSRLTTIRYRRAVFNFETESGKLPAFEFQPNTLNAKVVCVLPDSASLMLRSDVESLYFSQVYRPAWLDCLGRDAYGLYKDVVIKGISQRFRWIEPNSFLMGSPSDEPERDEGETQHQVTLTQGYWLADTACTQALWQAVIGNNPANFKDDLNNPVEQVSWLDAQEFLIKFNQLIPDLNARLPTEAEWEYACRAGTTTPFSFGDNITPEQVNYDGNQPYNNGEEGLYREKTVAVKTLPPNNWGLYEMHGNVWEWCSDCFADYPSESVTNPTGATDDTSRVLRGGSWDLNARYARSAFRRSRTPDDRSRNIGFRFALGQTAAEKQARTVATDRQAGAQPVSGDDAGGDSRNLASRILDKKKRK